MADTKRGRDKKAHDREKRQRLKAVHEERNRLDETEPPAVDVDVSLAELEAELPDHDYPTTSHDIVERFGEYEIATEEGWISVDSIFSEHHTLTFESPTAVRQRIAELIATE